MAFKLSSVEEQLIRERRLKLKNAIPLACHKCGYSWAYNGAKTKGFTSCPQCRNANVNIEKHKVRK